MLTKTNFKTMVGFQESFGSSSTDMFVNLLEVTNHPGLDWINYIQTMSNDEIIDNFNNGPKHHGFQVVAHAITCDKTFEDVLDEANSYLKSLPLYESSLSSPYYTHSAGTKIAFNSRRGPGKNQIGNILVYRGANEIDCCMVIAKSGGKYGLVKQKYFDRYGFRLDETKL